MNATAATATFERTRASAPAICRHCGERCGADALFTGAGPFCCTGCEAVFSLLERHGLQAFYTCDVNPGVSQRHRSIDAGRFAVLDEPEARGRFLEPLGADRAAVTFQVPALHCASCLWLIEQLWRFEPGIARSEADLLRRTVRVEFRPAETSLRAVAACLASLGYDPVIDSERGPGRMSEARRDLYLRIGVAGFAFGNVMLFSIPRYVNGAPLEGGFQRLFDVLNLLFAIPVLLYSASPYFRAAWAALRARGITIEVPVALGLVVLFGRSVVDIAMGWGEGFLDSFAGLVFFLLIGRLFQQKAFDGIAFDRTVRSFFPLSVLVQAGGAPARLTALRDIRPGDVMVVRPQEVVPADAVLLDQRGEIDYAFVSGESKPASIARGNTVHAGGRVVSRTLRLEAARSASHSRLADLWANPLFARVKPQWLTNLTAAFGFWFVVGALGLAIVGAAAWWPDARMAAQVATAVLIIACPCALTLSGPITLGTGMGLLGRAGCFLKSAGVGLDLSRIDTIVFDKTGTLTSGRAEAAASCDGLDSRDWQLVRRLAAESVHPVSRAIAGPDPVAGGVRDVRESPGAGIAGWVDGHRVAIGTAGFIAEMAGLTPPTADRRPQTDGGTCASVDGVGAAIHLGSVERPGLEDAIRQLGRAHQIWLLSGDQDAEAPRWRPLFGDRMRFRQSAEDKLRFVHELQQQGRRVLMIGDGLNDAGALAAADVGMAVSDDTACLVPACDVVIAGSRLRRLPGLLRYARVARQVIVLCFAVSVAYNVVGLGLALAGRLTPLATAILMPVSSLTIVGLSVGLMRRAGREVLAP